MLQEWNSLGDFIRFSKFKWHVEVDSKGKKVTRNPFTSGFLTSSCALVALGMCLGLQSRVPSGIFHSLFGVLASFSVFSRLRFFQESSLVLFPNDFPYYFEPGVHHYLLWKLNGVLNDAEVANAQRTVLQSHVHSVDTQFFVNPPTLRSIPEIDHAHILVFAPVK